MSPPVDTCQHKRNTSNPNLPLKNDSVSHRSASCSLSLQTQTLGQQHLSASQAAAWKHTEPPSPQAAGRQAEQTAAPAGSQPLVTFWPEMLHLELLFNWTQCSSLQWNPTQKQLDFADKTRNIEKLAQIISAFNILILTFFFKLHKLIWSPGSDL